MREEILFSNMFPDYEPPEALRQAAIVAADIDPATRRVSVAIYNGEYISKTVLDGAAKDICTAYGLAQLQIRGTYPETELTNVDPQDLMGMFMAVNSMNRGSLAGAKWEWEGTHLRVKLLANGKKELEEAIPQVQNTLREMFAVPVTIEIQPGEHLEGQALYDAMESMRNSMIAAIPAASVSSKKEEKKPDPQSETFYGKPFKGNVVPMGELNLDMGSVIVEGRVFAVEHKELKKRNAWVISFDMTDNTGSVRINRFLEAGEAKPILDNVKAGSVLKVQGKLELNRYDSELVLKPFSMMPGTMPKRKDKWEGEKRIELHMHTSMSNMDALTNTKALIKQAAAWGHKAVAITDHGCVQSFTDALHVVEDWKGPPKVAGTEDTIKILYGCEGYYVNDVDDRIAVHGTQETPFDGEFVAFDLETTGLSPKNDKIIEIGAVIMRGGKEISRYQTFVDPHQKLLKETTELTGITDEMLKGAPTIQQVLPEFLEFVGNRILVARWQSTSRVTARRC